MPSIRKTKTASGAVAVQVVRYENRKVVVLKHVGSTRDPEELAALVESARAWLDRELARIPLFPKPQRRTLPLSTAKYEGVTHALCYAVLSGVARRCGFEALGSRLLLDLACMRIVEPTSKLRAIMLLDRYFNIRYAERTVYRTLPKLEERKAEAERIAVTCAQANLHGDLALVLYDVTTLYFETFDGDDLRVPGFSKDNKAQQPQIVVGLLVTAQGYPLGYEVFRGNTFEGKTMIPVLEQFATAHAVKTLTVVADAAMLSRANTTELKHLGFSYIVGARLASCSPVLIEQIGKALGQKDGTTIRISTGDGDLVCGFSAKRFRKDSAEMERQIEKARALVRRREPGKRAKFVTHAEGDRRYVLDDGLIAKTTLLLGIRGYTTNVPQEVLSDGDVISRYHDLWHVEQAFRMAKSDLATRPIFHHKEGAIRAHLVICFVALAIAKYLEIETGLPLRRIVDMLWGVTDAKIIDTTTKEEFILRSELGDEVRELLAKLQLSY